MTRITYATVVSIIFGCFALLPRAQAVLPPPDGGYGPPDYGTGNTAEGEEALLNLGSGGFNTAAGFRTLFSNTTGNFNTAIGAGALFNNTGNQNTATGAGALLSNTSGRLNTANGEAALFFNIDGTQNTATGAGALESNTTGDFNTANGVNALTSNTDGARNTANGINALRGNTTGGFNTADGANTLGKNTTGNFNTALGSSALSNNSTGSGNIAIGFDAGDAVSTANNVICIGSNVDGANVNNSCYIGQIFGRTSSGGTAVFISSNGKLGTATSSRRFKEDIKPMDEASEALFSLTPVAFHYKKEIDPAGTPQLGLVAEDVEKVNPNLVVRDKEGKAYSVRYDQVNAMLLNEFLKEHRKVEELSKDFRTTIAQQQQQIEALTAGLQKVSAQLEASKSAPQIVNNP
jgi:Chaperone of endosialidase